MAEFSEHEADGGKFEEGKGSAVEAFPIFGQPSATIEPSNGAFDNPSFWQRDKAFGFIRTLDDFYFHARQNRGKSGVKDWPLIGAIGKKFSQKRKRFTQLG